MKYLKKSLAALLSVALLVPLFCLFSFAEDEGWLFIDGENITRVANTAIVYDQGETTNQNARGYSVVVGADGVVTAVIEAGSSEAEKVSIPEGGMVISAAGTKIEWLESKIAVGNKVFYDRYTKRLFVCDINGNVDPFGTNTFSVTEIAEENAYSITSAEGEEEDKIYRFGIAVDGNGTVVDRGDIVIPEGGFAIYAHTASARNDLIAYAPIGTNVTVSEGVATVNFTQGMLRSSLTLAINNAKTKLDAAKANFDYIDIEAAEELIAEAEEMSSSDYKAVSYMLYRLESEFENILTQTVMGELRGAYHTPDETTPTEVRATVLSAKAAGLNSIILRISNGYGSCVPLPEDNKFEQDAKFGGFDVVKSFADVCKEENVALTLCIDVYYNEYASLAAPEWLSDSNKGGTGLSSKYYSPANEEFKAYFIEYVEYIVSRYDIDSLMFDYLRYPKFTETTDLGYDYSTLQLFSKNYEIPMAEADAIKEELFASPHWEKWVEFRAGMVDSMARSLSEAVRAKRSDITLLAVAERDTVDHYYMQNSLGWIDEGVFDGVTVAFYERDVDESDGLGVNAYYGSNEQRGSIVADKGETFANYTGKDNYFFIGIESKSVLSAAELTKAINEGRSLGTDGFIFSDLESFIAQNYNNALKESVLRGTAVSPLGDAQSAMSKILEFSKHKIFEHIRVLEGCEEEKALAALDKIDKALEKLEGGILSSEEAKSLEGEIAILLAENTNAKLAGLKEFEFVTKMATLSKEKTEVTPPVDDGGEDNNDSSDEPINSEVSEDISQAVSQEESQTQQNENNEEPSVIFEEGFAAKVLIYVFVGVAAAAVIAFVVIAVKRKNKVPEKHHMPKAYDKEKDE